eukprot:jgi/Ulvmu1/7965/UM004_0198.1
MGAVARAVLSARQRLSELSKGVIAIALIVLAESLCGILVPSTRTVLALIPGYSIRYPWNIITSSFITSSFLDLFVAIAVLFGTAQVAEPIYGPTEFCKLIAVAALGCGCTSFLLQYAWFFFHMSGVALFSEHAGFYGVQGALFVAVKHVMPGQDVNIFPGAAVPTRFLPAIYVSALALLSVITGDLTALRFAVVGTFSGWLYLRFFKPSGPDGQRGDPSVDFALSTMCPASVQPAFSALFTAVAKRLGVHREPPPVLPIVAPRDAAAASAIVRAAGGPDAPDWDASRRREVGRMALAARLAASGLSTSTEASPATTRSASQQNLAAAAEDLPTPK